MNRLLFIFRTLPLASLLKLLAGRLLAPFSQASSKWKNENKILMDEYHLLSRVHASGWGLTSSAGYYQVAVKENERRKPIFFRLRKKSSDFAVFRTVIVMNEYKLASFVFEKLIQRSPKVIVDAGANIGLSTLYFKTMFPSASVIAIEPEPSNFKALIENVKENQLVDVKVYEAALWNSNCHLKIDRNFRDGLEWSVRVLESDASDAQLTGIDIGTILRENQLGHIDLFKMDIEGAEAILFKDDYLAQYLDVVTCFMIEVHPEFIAEKDVTLFFLRRDFSILKSGKETLLAMNNKFNF